ncbi:putative trafficking protein particle complex II-specific subunit [Cardamine amara subsp. amara]|uniref:Trafficking protein particle complex II-specific subunit n=1 Tax=Cardamine amara subsp. amara TaxID=228776 RepID=A0ABD1AIC1_CARAN
MRTVALKLEFGVHHNQIFERTIAAHFTDPFDVTTRVANKCNDGTLVLQVMLHSLVKANLIVLDAWLDLQGGFVHGQKDGRPTSTFFPLVVSPGSRAAVVFSICLDKNLSSEGKDLQLPQSILNIKYGINGDRTGGAHKPVDADHSGTDTEGRDLVFKSAIVLQRPVLDPCLTVGFLPLPSDGLRVGKLITMQWRVERLKDLKESEAVEEQHDEVLYEVNANSEIWMIAGRKRGHVSLSEEQGSRVVISILCVPLVAGYVRPPQLGLPNVEEANVSSNPPGPHLVCVLSPLLSSSYCVPVK